MRRQSGPKLGARQLLLPREPPQRAAFLAAKSEPGARGAVPRLAGSCDGFVGASQKRRWNVDAQEPAVVQLITSSNLRSSAIASFHHFVSTGEQSG